MVSFFLRFSSRRQWDGAIKAWRKGIHKYDPENPNEDETEGANAGGNSTRDAESNSAAGTTFNIDLKLKGKMFALASTYSTYCIHPFK